MYDLVSTTGGLDSNSRNASAIGTFTSGVLSAVPLALAKPILDYHYTDVQANLLKTALETRRQERADILGAMCELARHSQLTPELYQMMMTAYGLPALT